MQKSHKRGIVEKSYFSPLGEIILRSDGANLISLYFKDSTISARFAHDSRNSHIINTHELFAESFSWLDIYFRGEIPRITPRFMLQAMSPFQRQVLEIVRKIPRGKVRTYGEVAREIAPNMSAQAVGSALKHNPIALIIPCHRVVGAQNLGGYNGGKNRKIALLKLESA